MIGDKNYITIGIIEPEFHSEVVRTFILSLLSHHIKLKVFTAFWVYNQLNDLWECNDIDWFLCDDSAGILQLVRKESTTLAQCHDIIWTSYPFLNTSFTIPIIPTTQSVVIHNLHTICDPFSHLIPPSPLGLLRILKYLPVLLKRNRIRHVSSFTRVLLPSDEVLHYFESQKYNLPVSVISFPLYLNESSEIRNETGLVKIAIPGTVSTRNRDYHTLLEGLFLTSIQRPVEVTLLGKFDEKKEGRIRKMIARLREHPLVSIQTFDDFVPQSLYDEIVKNSDFLILPVQKWKRYGPVIETFGKSTLSGTLQDAIRFSIPAIMSGEYSLPPAIEPFIKSYHNAKSLSLLLSQWIKTGEYRRIKEESISSFKTFDHFYSAGKYLSNVLNSK